MSDVLSYVWIDSTEGAEDIIRKSAPGSKFRFSNCGLIHEELMELAISKASSIAIRGDSKLVDLEALNSPTLESLTIYSYSQVVYKGTLYGERLQKLKNAQLIGLSGDNLASFNECPALECLFLQDMDLSKRDFFSKFNHLKKLSLTNIKVKWDDLLVSDNLRELNLNNVSLENLNFLQKVTKLTFLDLSRMRKLKSLKGVEALSQLEQFDLQSMTNIKDLSPLSQAKNLKVLQLVDVGEVETLAFMTSSKSLERFLFVGAKAKVRDNDFSWLTKMENLKYASFTDRRGYSHKSDDFRKD